MKNKYTDVNTVERQNLFSIIKQLTVEQLNTSVGNAGWTVAGLLGHLAFWDLRAYSLICKWKKEGVGSSPIDIDIVNEALRKHCLLIPAGEAVEFALSAATIIDQEIEKLDIKILGEIERNGKTVHLDRSPHRRHHLNQITNALGIMQD
jgi:hypothetical protein